MGFLISNGPDIKKKAVLLIVFFLVIAATTSFINLCDAASKMACHKKYDDCAYKTDYLVENNKSPQASFWECAPIMDSAKHIAISAEMPARLVEIDPHLSGFSLLIKSAHPPQGPPLA